MSSFGISTFFKEFAFGTFFEKATQDQDTQRKIELKSWIFFFFYKTK
jgi:hypothetical protein